MSDPVAALGGREETPRPGLAMSEVGPVGQITLRAADLSDEAVSGALSTVLGLPVPSPLSVALPAAPGEDGRRAVWMAPDELLLILPRGDVADAIRAIGEALAGTRHMALDVSDARVLVRIEGEDARETLAKGVPVDLSDDAFPVGRARRTHLGGLAVGVFRVGEADWELVCFRSFAHHLFGWLADAGREGAEVGRFQP